MPALRPKPLPKPRPKPRPAWQKRVPNAITLVRGLSVFPIIALVMGSPLQAFVGWLVFLFACLGDFIDGYFARRWNAISPFGTAFDPIIDKILILAVFVAVLAHGGLDSSFLPQQDGIGMSQLAFGCAFLILAREIVVSGLREFLAQKLHVSLPVVALAKDKTILQMLGVGGQILSIVALAGQRQLWVSLLVDLTLAIACFVTLYTGFLYSRNAFALLKQGKRKGNKKQ